jgi:hypothetical protein
MDVALRMLGVGIARSVLDATVARHRACRPFFVNRPRTLADLIVEGLNICDNMMSGDVVCVMCGSFAFGVGLGRLSVY